MKVFIVIVGLMVGTFLVAGIAMADPVGGGKLFKDTVGKRMQHDYDLVLKENEPTLVTLEGNGRSDIDCFLYDENGGMIDFDVDETDTCALTVTPKWAGHFTLRVVNVGNSVSTYHGSAR